MTSPNPNPPVGANEGANKAIFAGLGGAVAIVLIYIIDQVVRTPLPPEICAAAQTIVVTCLVYFVPRKFGND
ncbi:hypothetical protein [Acidocella sp.]|jgi:hypothetical protein|uniref:hypothetical protein n=1 Tax=Acidocella sp. TaxID=50710 RepID=UPI002F40775D